MSDIILGAPSILGELAPLLAMSRWLIEKRHGCTLIAADRHRDEVEATGAAFAGFATMTAEQEAEHVRGRAGLVPGPEMFNTDMEAYFLAPTVEHHRILQSLLEQDPDQVLISNQLFFGAMPAALGAPGRRPRRWVGVGAGPLALDSDDTTVFGPVQAPSEEESRRGNREANAAMRSASEPSDALLNRMLGDLGAGPLPSSYLDAMVTLPDVYAEMSVEGFEFHRDDAPDSLRFVGVIPPPQASDGWQEPAWWDDLSQDRPVVVVTQGTYANDDLGELVEPALAGLADQDVLVVAALGRDVEALSGPVPDNARVERYVPFGALLPRADVLVTNGGFGGTQQAIAAGVPVVVAGVIADKPATAARVARHGLGVDLATGNPSSDDVAAAVRTVLGSEEIKANVDRLAGAYRGMDARALIEELALG